MDPKKLKLNHAQMSDVFINHLFQDRIAIKFNDKYMVLTIKVENINIVCRYKIEAARHINFIAYVPTFCTVLTAMQAILKIPETDKTHESYRTFIIKTLHSTKAQNVVFNYINPEKK